MPKPTLKRLPIFDPVFAKLTSIVWIFFLVAIVFATLAVLSFIYIDFVRYVFAVFMAIVALFILVIAKKIHDFRKLLRSHLPDIF